MSGFLKRIMKILLLNSVILLMFSGFVTAASVERHASMNEDHSKHKASLHTNHVERYTVPYQYADISLVDSDGLVVSANDLFSNDKPIVLNFIFTTCTTICPVLSATFSQLQKTLNELDIPPKMVSISIDPEQDTPARLREYAKKFDALPLWSFYTGKSSDIVNLQRSFDIYRGNKVNHIPVTFMRNTTDTRWLRIDGFVSNAELLSEYKSLVGM